MNPLQVPRPNRHVVVASAVPPTNAGGLQMATASLSAALIRGGLNVTLLSPAAPPDQQSLAPPGVHHISLPSLPFYHPLFVRALRVGLRTIIAHRPADAVISESAAIYGGAGICRDTGIPIVLHAHGSALRELRAATLARSPLRIAYRALLLLVDRVYLPSATAIAAVTPAIGEEVAKLAGPRMGPPIYLPNAVDTGRFQPDPVIRDRVRREMAVPEQSRVVVFLGRLSPEKGPDLVLQAIPILKALHPDALFWFIGDGVLRGRLESDVGLKGLSPSVRFWGRVSPDTVRNALAAADVLALPSRRPEGMPYAILEAQAMGIPSVTPDVVDISPLSTHVFRANDPKDLAKALVEALRTRVPDPSLRNTIVRQHSQNAYDTTVLSILDTLWSGAPA